MSEKCYKRPTEKYFQNVNGKHIKLIINNNETKQACVEFIIKTVDLEKNRRKSIVVFLLAACNIILFYLNLLPQVICLFIFIMISSTLLMLLLTVKNERLLIVKSLGLQVTVTYYMGFHTTQFVPWDLIQKVFINEVITLQRVLYILTIMTKDADNSQNLIPLFQHTMPRLNCLGNVYRQIVDIISR